jgi:hypothetical protein
MWCVGSTPPTCPWIPCRGHWTLPTGCCRRVAPTSTPRATFNVPTRRAAGPLTHHGIPWKHTCWLGWTRGTPRAWGFAEACNS